MHALSTFGGKLRDFAFSALPLKHHHFLHAIRYAFASAGEKAGWVERTRLIQSSPDNARLPRSAGAGTIADGLLTMHNGVKVLADSYFGFFGRKMFAATQGLHEPQEEAVFSEVLRELPPGATMLELGAYWAFYSLWFKQRIPGGRCFLVEPDVRNLAYGKANFASNGHEGVFQHAFVGEKSSAGTGRPPVICVDDFLREHGIEQLDVLHADIQGFELEMLRGAEKSIVDRRVRYVFISTHSSELHAQCLTHLREREFHVLTSVDLPESYSVDGLIVARAAHVRGPSEIAVSKRPAPVF